MGDSNAKKIDPITIILKEMVLGLQEIEAHDHILAECLDVEYADIIIGPVKKEALRDLLLEITLPEETLVSEHGHDHWVHIYDHPFFKPEEEEESEESKVVSSVLLLMEGQKMGPYTIEEIRKKVEHQKILLSQICSPDNGKTWHPIYDLEAFDRRKKKGLPHKAEFTSDKIRALSEQDEKTGAFANLVYLENCKAGKSKKTDMSRRSTDKQQNNTQTHTISLDELNATIPPKNDQQSIYKKVFLFSLMGLLLLFIIPSGKDKVEKKEKVSRKKIKKAKKELKQKKATEVTKSKPSKPSRETKAKVTKRSRERQRSFRENDKFRQRRAVRRGRSNRRPKAKSDDFYEDEHNDPVEQDRMQADLDKETLDPLEDRYPADEDYDKEEDPPID